MVPTSCCRDLPWQCGWARPSVTLTTRLPFIRPAPRKSSRCARGCGALRSLDSGLRKIGEILRVGDLLHPSDILAVARLLNGDVGHALVGRRAVPMPVFGRAPQNVASVELHLRFALDLGPTDAFGDNQRPTARVCVPVGARAGFEMHDGAGYARRFLAHELARDGDLASERLGRTLGCYQILLARNAHCFSSYGGGCKAAVSRTSAAPLACSKAVMILTMRSPAAGTLPSVASVCTIARSELRPKV